MRRSSTPQRWLWRALLLILLIFAAAVAGGIFYLKNRISPERISAEATALISRNFGLGLTIGELNLTWSGNISLKRVCVRNEAMSSPRCLFAADIAELDLRLLPLLKKQIEIRGAWLENGELNLFSETAEGSDKKKTVRKSWELPPRSAQSSENETGIAEAGGAPLMLRLEHLRIRNAVIAHEARALPLPLGHSNVSLELEKAGKRLLLQGQLPDQSRLKAELELNIRDFFRTAQFIVAEGKLAYEDHVSGILECERCDLSALDARAGFLTGSFRLEASGQKVVLQAENMQLTTKVIYTPHLTLKGNATFALPEFYPTAGEGSLTGQGLSLAYRKLAGSKETGLAVEFDVAADLARLPGLTGIEGTAVARGRVSNRSPYAFFSLKNFSASAAGMAISAEKLNGELSGQRIRLNKQNVLLAGNAAEITLDADIAGRIPSIAGSLAFRELRLTNLSDTTTPAPKAEPKKAASQASSTPHLRASIQLSATALNLGKLKTGPLSAQLISDGTITELRSWQVEFGQGRMQGSYQRFPDGKQNLVFRVISVKAQEFRELLGFKATLYGTVDAEGRLAFAGNTADALLKTAAGQVHFRLGRGKIRDSFLQKGVLSGPLHKLEEKFSDIEFASAQAELLLTENKIEIRRFYFDAEEWNVTYRAEADRNWQGKAALVFRFRSSFVENVANPLHMGVADRKDGDFYDLPFACRGAVLSGDCYKKNW